MAGQSLREFATSLNRAANRVPEDAAKIVKRGAVNIKKQMQAEARGHRHFPRLGASISFEIGGPGGLSAEIGPTGGVLAGIAYFGSSRPGGNTVPDPKGALDAEAPVVERLLGDLGQRVIANGP